MTTKKDEEKTPTEVPPVKNVLREPDREKSKLTEILLILIIILLGATSVYFYQANERLTERYNSLSQGLDDNSGSLAVLEKDFYALKSEKDNSKEMLEQIKQDVNGLLQMNVTIKDRVYNLSEGQRGNMREINRIITKISASEKDTAISELKKALVIVNGINRKGTAKSTNMIGEKLESDIVHLIKEIASDGKVPETAQKPEVKPEVKAIEKPVVKIQEKETVKEETKKSGFGKIELQEATTEQEETPPASTVIQKKEEPIQDKPLTTDKQ